MRRHMHHMTVLHKHFKRCPCIISISSSQGLLYSLRLPSVRAVQHSFAYEAKEPTGAQRRITVMISSIWRHCSRLKAFSVPCRCYRPDAAAGVDLSGKVANAFASDPELTGRQIVKSLNTQQRLTLIEVLQSQNAKSSPEPAEQAAARFVVDWYHSSKIKASMHASEVQQKIVLAETDSV